MKYILILYACFTTSCRMDPWASHDAYSSNDQFEGLSSLIDQRHKLNRKIFYAICEAAGRRDTSIRREIDLHRESNEYLVKLASSCYRYQMGDLDEITWMLSEFDKHGIGRESMILIAFGYMDEWDETIDRFRLHKDVSDGAASEVLTAAMEIRKKIYGRKKFERAWNTPTS